MKKPFDGNSLVLKSGAIMGFVWPLLFLLVKIDLDTILNIGYFGLIFPMLTFLFSSKFNEHKSCYGLLITVLTIFGFLTLGKLYLVTMVLVLPISLVGMSDGIIGKSFKITNKSDKKTLYGVLAGVMGSYLASWSLETLNNAKLSGFGNNFDTFAFVLSTVAFFFLVYFIVRMVSND